MAVQIRPGYAEPLTITADKRAPQWLGKPAVGQGGQTDRVAELQTKRQQLQNQMLLLKATGTDSVGAAAETKKVVEAELEKVTDELRSAKGSGVQAVKQVEQSSLGTTPTAVRRSEDRYEPEKADGASPGIYQIEEDEKEGYRVSFLPYSEG